MDRFLTHRFGVNYVPSRNWYYSWNDFDPDSIARDMDALAGLSMDHIRLHTIWPWFQPNPATVSEAHLTRLRCVVELAGERGLDVWVAAFNGWLSGFAFVPPYLTVDSFYREEAWDAQSRYLSAMAQALGDCPNFGGFDLGNEMNCCWRTQDLAEGDRWMARAFAECRAVSPQGVHVNGLDHQPWLWPSCFSPKALAEEQEIVPLHSWAFYTGAFERGGPLGAPSVHLLRTMAALVRSYAGDPCKPVWMQEFGASLEWMTQEEAPRFMEASVRHGIEGGISWFTWWCSHDIDPRYQFISLEYDLGLLDLDNKPKPQALLFRDLAREMAGRPVAFPAAPPSPPEHNNEASWEWMLAML